MDILDFARKNKSDFSLKPSDVRRELEILNERLNKQTLVVKPEFKRNNTQ